MAGYPLWNYLQEMTGGHLVASTQASDVFVLSERGGDLRLRVGSDLSLGFERRNGDDVELYFLETFTFRAIGPEAVVIVS